ncbi:MAG: 8-hydroxy-5-deazaflavin:NADPH oxidoreductase [Gaiellales bacterium]|jgi:predicted dinucleotide-binding enzyme|nr:8-hydroxy-5-deazaflavin:NADPH oxidoreductase [Gaiellales bacterium]
MTMPRIAVIGAGHAGPVIARLVTDAGYPVSITGSGDPDQIALLAQVLTPGADPRWTADAVADAEMVVLSIPLHRLTTLDPSLLAGKTVIDAMNYWPPTDGVQELFEDQRTGSSEIVQGRLTQSRVVKTLNQIGYHDLEDGRRPAGAADRLAIGVAGDDARAVDQVAELVDRVGYDPVRLGSLKAGRALEPGNAVFGAALGRDDFEAAVCAMAAA